jgi:exonuclease VII large subunit
LPHGHFIKWIETNIPSISRMTANRYLRVYENQDFLREKLGDSLEINRAYKLLSKPQKTINPKNKNEVLKNKLDNHLLDSIKLHKQKVTHAKKNLLKGKPINKIEKKLLQKDTQEKRNKILSSIDKARARLEKLEEILSKLEM